MQIVLVIWAKSKHLTSSALTFCSFLIDRISYSFLLVGWLNWVMAEIVSQHLLSRALLSLESQRILSWWICCFSLFATMWFRVCVSQSLKLWWQDPHWGGYWPWVSWPWFSLSSSLLSLLGCPWRGIRVYSPHTYSVSLVYLAPLSPGCQHPLPLLPTQAGCNAQKVSQCNTLGIAACSKTKVVGPSFQELSDLSCFPHSLFWWFCW